MLATPKTMMMRPVPFPQNKVLGVDAIVQQVVRLDGTRY